MLPLHKPPQQLLRFSQQLASDSVHFLRALLLPAGGNKDVDQIHYLVLN